MHLQDRKDNVRDRPAPKAPGEVFCTFCLSRCEIFAAFVKSVTIQLRAILQLDHLLQFDEIWVPSEFNRQVFAASGIDIKDIYLLPEVRGCVTIMAQSE